MNLNRNATLDVVVIARDPSFSSASRRCPRATQCRVGGLIDRGSTTGALGDIARLRLGGAQQLIFEVRMSPGKPIDHFHCERQEFDRALVDAQPLEAQHAGDIDRSAGGLSVDDNAQGGVHVQVQVNVNAK